MLSNLKLMGFDVAAIKKSRRQSLTIEDAQIEQAIQLRLKHFIDKNWAEADRIRDELLDQGIQLKDSKDAETGERITTWEVKR